MNITEDEANYHLLIWVGPEYFASYLCGDLYMNLFGITDENFKDILNEEELLERLRVWTDKITDNFKYKCNFFSQVYQAINYNKAEKFHTNKEFSFSLCVIPHRKKDVKKDKKQ